MLRITLGVTRMKRITNESIRVTAQVRELERLSEEVMIEMDGE